MAKNKKNVPVAVPSNPLTIYDRTVCLDISFSIPGVKRKMDTAELNEDADAQLIHVSKDLLSSPELQAIRTLDAKIMNYLRGHSCPSPFLKRGIYLIPNGLVKKIDERLNHIDTTGNYDEMGFFQQRQELINDFIKKYPKQKEEAKKRLKEHYDESEYPKPARLRAAFRVAHKWFSLATPDNIKNIAPTIFEQEQEKAKKEWSNSFNEIQQALRQGFLQMLDTVNGSLNPLDGKKKRFKTVTIERLLEFMDTFNDRNITDDVELAKIVAQAKSLISEGKSGKLKPQALAEDLRENEGFRKSIQSKFGNLCKNLASITVDVTESRGILGLDD